MVDSPVKGCNDINAICQRVTIVLTRRKIVFKGKRKE